MSDGAYAGTAAELAADALMLAESAGRAEDGALASALGACRRGLPSIPRELRAALRRGVWRAGPRASREMRLLLARPLSQ